MSTSTNGQICFGIPFEEGYSFPWDGRSEYDEHESDPDEVDFDGDAELWWFCQKSPDLYEQWQNNSPYINGEYKPGYSSDDPRISPWFDIKRDWLKTNPLPFEMVNYCSGDCPMYIFAVPSSVQSANRGYPEEINPLIVLLADVEKLKEFVKEWFGVTDEPKWYLSSYWG